MRIYPNVPSRRTATLVRDAVVLVLLFLLAFLALEVRSAVNELAVFGEGVQEAGSSIQGGFDSAADAVEGTPFIGDEVAEGFRGAGEGSGGNVAELGAQGRDKTHQLANLLGLLTFLLPALLLLALYVPSRARQIRSLTAASKVLGETGGTERRRLLAMRAAFSLPYGELLRFTRDPLGDLEAERYDALVAAAYDEVGLRLPAR